MHSEMKNPMTESILFTITLANNVPSLPIACAIGYSLPSSHLIIPLVTICFPALVED